MIKLNNEYKAFNPVDTQYSLKPIYHYYYYYCYYQYHSFVNDNHWFGEVRISEALWVWWLCCLDEESMTWGLKWWSGEIMMGKGGLQSNNSTRQYSAIFSPIVMFTTMFTTITGFHDIHLELYLKLGAIIKVAWWKLPLCLCQVSVQLISLYNWPTQSNRIKCCQGWGEWEQE